MMALAMPPNHMHAKTTTAPVLQTLEPAAIRTGRVVVSVDTTHFEPLIGSKDGCILPKFQGAFRPGRVRSQKWRA